MFDHKLNPVQCRDTRGCSNFTVGRRRRVAQAGPTTRRVPPVPCAPAAPSVAETDASALVAAFTIGVASAVLAVMLMVNVATRADAAGLF